MAEKFFEFLLSTQRFPKETNFNQWLLSKFKDPLAFCSLDEFAAFYLSLVKTQTDEFIRSNTSTCNTPRKLTVGNLVEHAGGSLLPSTTKTLENEDVPRINSNENHQTGKRQPSRQLFTKQSTANVSDVPVMNSPFSNNTSGAINSSTPVSFSKSQRSFEGSPANRSTPHSFNKTKNSSFSFTDQSPVAFRNSRNSLDMGSRNTSANRRNTSSPFCLGDFINTSSSGKGKQKKNSSQQFDATPIFNNSDFPSIGENSPNDSHPKKMENKPKKRVVPITISKKTTPNSSNFISSSFQSDNNLVNLTGSEADGSVDMLSERKKLRDERDAISKDFTLQSEPQRNLHAFVRESFPAVTQSPRKAPTFHFDDSKVERKELLVLMAKTYSFLLDMNLVPNILSEFTYFFNLLNTEHEAIDQVANQTQGKSIVEIGSSVLRNLQNCVFFTVHVLNCQKQNLALLDVMTIRVIIDNERTQQLTAELYEHLRLTVQAKSRLDMSLQSTANPGNNLSQVFFQQETDNRDNFPSDREFGAFKKQRDLFYVVLRAWELKHLEANYDFQVHLGAKIRLLVTHMEHPVNMSHLARLFTAQLIISCNFDNAANELQMVLPNIDLSKLSKLRQRLVEPSQFSTQYLFPGSQAFFRDFITCCSQHLIFMEQLKISLINELMQINDSNLEVFCITRSNDDESNEKTIHEEFIVRSEAITTMRVLAKFVGFVISRPHSYEGYRNSLIDQQQSQIRNFLHPDFDVKQVVLRAIDGHKLLVTIPWLVEYLSMLDFITIRLQYYRELFQLLHSIYLRVNVVNGFASLCVLPTSKFIVRSCLGWLFEHPIIPEDYFHPAKVELNELPINDTEAATQPNPHLENILNAACPFLADFRVSMMPQHTTKAVSRTGRYRHITTKFQDKSLAQTTKVQDDRSRLIEAFLASQTISVRKIVNFTVERVASAVVKDFQVEQILAVKKQAKADVEELAKVTADYDSLVRKISEVYLLHLSRLHDIWTEVTRTNSIARVQGAFNSLLPIEMLPDVKKNLVNIALEQTNEKLQDWSSANLATVEIFSKDIHADALKLKEKSKENGKAATRSMSIDLSGDTMPSDYFNCLQHLLYKATRRPEQIESDELHKTAETAIEVVERQNLPDNAYRNIAFYTLQTVLMCIANRCDVVTEEALKTISKLWRHEKLAPYTRKDISSNDRTTYRPLKVDDFIFSNVVSPRLMLTLQGKPQLNLAKFADFLVYLMRENFVTAEQINEQSVGLYKCEWPAESLRDIGFLMSRVKASLPSGSSADSQHFMELVADLAKEMENF